MQARSSNGRAAVSKTEGWGFESLRACHKFLYQVSAMKIFQGLRRFFSRIGKFVGEVRGELKKVIWPSGGELRVYTLAVLAAMVGIGVILWGTDALLTLVVGFLTKR